MVFSKLEIAVEKILEIKAMKSCVSSAYMRCEMEERIVRVLREVVSRLKGMEPRTEP